MQAYTATAPLSLNISQARNNVPATTNLCYVKKIEKESETMKQFIYM